MCMHQCMSLSLEAFREHLKRIFHKELRCWIDKRHFKIILKALKFSGYPCLIKTRLTSTDKQMFLHHSPSHQNRL